MPKEVEELVFVWASRLSPYPWVRFDYPFPFVIRSKNRGELQCLLKQVVFTDKFDDDIQKVTPARAPLAFFFSLSALSVLMSKSFSFGLLRLRAKTAWLWLHATTAILTVRCPQRYFHGDQRRI
ncbi:hypothetical protein TNCV_110261 [Trichonephila clavipes]|nr:hypothetical protein TNCV_110261 [Trichonephila clavipes]